MFFNANQDMQRMDFVILSIASRSKSAYVVLLGAIQNDVMHVCPPFQYSGKEKYI